MSTWAPTRTRQRTRTPPRRTYTDACEGTARLLGWAVGWDRAAGVVRAANALAEAGDEARADALWERELAHQRGAAK